MVRALTRLSHLALTRSAVVGNATTTPLDMKDYVGTVKFDLNAISLSGGSSPVLDVQLRTGAASNAMAAVSGGAFTQVGNVMSDQAMLVDMRSLNRWVDFSYTVGGTGTFACSITSHGVKQVGA